MKRTILILLSLLPLCLVAQDYEHSAGVRLGLTSGLTYKKFVNDTEAFEILWSGRRDGSQITALYEFHRPMEVAFNESFYFYYGVGGHIGYERFDDLRKVIVSEVPLEFEYEERGYFAMGVDGILGVEYRYLEVPMTISFEVKPYLNFIGMRYTKSTFWDAGFSFKYIF